MVYRWSLKECIDPMKHVKQELLGSSLPSVCKLYHNEGVSLYAKANGGGGTEIRYLLNNYIINKVLKKGKVPLLQVLTVQKVQVEMERWKTEVCYGL